MTKEPRTYHGEGTFPSINGAGKLDSHVLKMELAHSFTAYTNVSSKWIKALNVRPETIKFVKYTGGKLFDIGLSDDFLSLTPKAKTPKANKKASSQQKKTKKKQKKPKQSAK